MPFTVTTMDCLKATCETLVLQERNDAATAIILYVGNGARSWEVPATRYTVRQYNCTTT